VLFDIEHSLRSLCGIELSDTRKSAAALAQAVWLLYCLAVFTFLVKLYIFTCCILNHSLSPKGTARPSQPVLLLDTTLIPGAGHNNWCQVWGTRQLVSNNWEVDNNWYPTTVHSNWWVHNSNCRLGNKHNRGIDGKKKTAKIGKEPICFGSLSEQFNPFEDIGCYYG
jgi:hypothetical protein